MGARKIIMNRIIVGIAPGNCETRRLLVIFDLGSSVSCFGLTGTTALTVTWFDSKQSYGEHGYGSTVLGARYWAFDGIVCKSDSG